MASFLYSRRRLQIPIDAGHLFRRDAGRLSGRNAHQRARESDGFYQTSVPLNRYVGLPPDDEVEGNRLVLLTLVRQWPRARQRQVDGPGSKRRPGNTCSEPNDPDALRTCCRFSSKLPAIHDLRRPSGRASADLANNAGSLALSPSWRSAQSPPGWHLRCSWPRYHAPDRKLQLGIS